MNFSQLREADAEAWWNLRLEALEQEPLAFGQSVEEHRATTLEQMASRLRAISEAGFVMGGFDGSHLIAVATLSRETGVKERHKAHLYGVYVRAAYRGRGAGGSLLSSVLERAKEDSSLEQILLGVGAYNTAAIKTYQRAGFVSYGTEPRALKVGDAYVDEHLMIADLRGAADLSS